MNRRIGLIALAVVLGLIGTFAVYSYAHNADKRAIARTRSTTVLYASKDVPVGTKWKDAVNGGYFTQQRVPVEAAPTTAIPNIAASVPNADVATTEIHAGQIVVREMFGIQEATTGILPIPKGMQAVSVSMPASSEAAGFVEPGSQVAVYVTSKLKGAPASVAKASLDNPSGQSDLFITKLLLARVNVIATSAGPPTTLTGKNSSSSSTTTESTVMVTFALDQKSAERLILGQTIGQLYMALLNNDSVVAPDPGQLNVGDVNPAPIFGPGQ
jgi:pilus assembly protein CpaB